MSLYTKRWIARSLAFTSLGALGGMTVQKSLPFNEWVFPFTIAVFLVASYTYAYLPGGEE